MRGETKLALAVLPSAQPGDLLPAWERFALPLRSIPAGGHGRRLPERGMLLDFEDAQLSSVRRRAGVLEARLWNPTDAPLRARLATRGLTLSPARIETISIQER